MKQQKAVKGFAKLLQMQSRAFSHGPYNPLHYKHVGVDEDMPTTEDYYATIKSMH